MALGESVARVLEVPGHTVGHIAYYFAEAGALFSADSLMVMGCGRLFEGTPEQMWASLSRLAALPDETLVYSGHEYAESNTRFALSVDAENAALQARAAEIAAMRQMGGATVPARLDLERATNPFLRAADAGLQGPAGAGEFAGCPSFRRGPPAQGRFLSRPAARPGIGADGITAFFLRFRARGGIIALEARMDKTEV